MEDNWHTPTKFVPSRPWSNLEKTIFDNSIKKIVADKWSVQPKDLTKNFKPASKEQIQEWLGWIESAKNNIENIKKYEQLKEKEQKLIEDKSLKLFNHIVFDPYKEEYKKESFFEADKKYFQNSDYYRAYEYFGKQQLKLYKQFDLDKTSENYKKLMKHIHNHGKYIDKIPEEPKEEEIDEKPVKQYRRNIRVTAVDDKISNILDQETNIDYDDEDDE